MSTERRIGTVSRGIRCPIFREGDDLASLVVDSVLQAAASDDGFAVRDRDILCITESVVARCQGNYAGVEDIADDVRAKLGGGTVGVIWPILSRNRFAICLRDIAKGSQKQEPPPKAFTKKQAGHMKHSLQPREPIWVIR